MSQTEHVLIVEDSTLLSDAFKIIFEVSGYRVSVANTMADAILVQETVDVALLDLTLPDGDGLSALNQLRSLGRSPRVAIALTGHDDTATRKRCLDAGCDEVLVKPVAMGELVKRVRTLLA